MSTTPKLVRALKEVCDLLDGLITLKVGLTRETMRDSRMAIVDAHLAIFEAERPQPAATNKHSA